MFKRENYLFALLALTFSFNADLFAQDYKKLSRKKLRIEHQKKLNLSLIHIFQ